MAENRPVIVVTYSVLGDIVSQLVGDNATVTVVIPDGQDPHDFQPSAKDVETMNNAALVISNGLDFEEGLEEVIENIADSGGEVFMVGDHVTVRKTEEEDGHSHSHGDDDDDADHAEGEDGHGHGAGDPHLWLSPATMLEMLPALSKALSTAAGTDLSEAEKVLTTELEELDKQITTIIDGLDECKLVSGHDEMGYFADRYGCEVIGAIIPSLTTTSEATAGELADLKKLAQKNKVPAIFTGLGTSPEIANQIASELGVKAVTLSTHYLDGATNYQEFILRMVQQIAEALG
ncbi:MAG: metal ABC transporter substrate-binding protein [Actinomycetota bacterium]